MRVISCVPSWTETLLECGFDVVGRTRFCIHPDRARAIPAVGGTKDIDWAKANGLAPDAFLFDREENPRRFADECAKPFHATWIRSVSDVAVELRALASFARTLGETTAPCARLEALAVRWERVASLRAEPLPLSRLSELPGVVDWIRKPDEAGLEESFQATYVIWRDPWMGASPGTFIGSALERVGLGGRLAAYAEPYPNLNFDCLNCRRDLLLFSTEPFPFLKIRGDLKTLPFACAIVDGEGFSWFGIRALRFLESALGLAGLPQVAR